jgi:hypothetical protein
MTFVVDQFVKVMFVKVETDGNRAHYFDMQVMTVLQRMMICREAVSRD